MERLERDAPLPEEMQGCWRIVEEPEAKLIVDGGRITCFGQVVAYDYKLVSREHEALTVSLEILDKANEDTFQRANITGLVITPEGDFHAYNVKFASQFEREPGWQIASKA